MKTTTTIYHLLLTQFWPNFKVRFFWPIIIITTKTTTTFLGCDSIEFNLVSTCYCTNPNQTQNGGKESHKKKRIPLVGQL